MDTKQIVDYFGQIFGSLAKAMPQIGQIISQINPMAIAFIVLSLFIIRQIFNFAYHIFWAFIGGIFITAVLPVLFNMAKHLKYIPTPGK